MENADPSGNGGGGAAIFQYYGDQISGGKCGDTVFFGAFPVFALMPKAPDCAAARRSFI